jgi:hypothetical protein
MSENVLKYFKTEDGKLIRYQEIYSGKTKVTIGSQDGQEITEFQFNSELAAREQERVTFRAAETAKGLAAEEEAKKNIIYMVKE